MYQTNSLRFEFQAGKGSFDSAGNTKISISDVKAIADVEYTGNYGGYRADVTIYGLGQDLIAMLSAKGIGPYTNTDLLISMDIYANETLIFSGSIYACYANMNTVPEAGLVINAVAGLDLMRASTKPYSVKGSTPVVDILSSICTPNGYNVETYGISGYSGSNSYFVGSPLEQVRQVCMHFDFQMAISGKTVTVWKRSEGINTVIAEVSPDNGLIGYPVFTQAGIMYQTTFSPYLAQGQQVKLTTSLPNATGTYLNFAVRHRLSSWIKQGPWISVCQASKIYEGKNNGSN